jgi:antitoxin ParD1/3/4
MPISLPPELEAFAYRQIEAGRYRSIEELLVDAVRALSDRQEDIYQGRFEELQAEVQTGIDALDGLWPVVDHRGESQDMEIVMDNLRQKIGRIFGNWGNLPETLQ